MCCWQCIIFPFLLKTRSENIKPNTALFYLLVLPVTLRILSNWTISKDTSIPYIFLTQFIPGIQPEVEIPQISLDLAPWKTLTNDLW